MSSDEPSFSAQCGDCKQTADLPDGPAEMLLVLREFLDDHSACSFEVALRLVSAQRLPAGRTVDLTTPSAANAG